MEYNKSYQRLPVPDRIALIDLRNDKEKLFNHIINSINSQKTIKSKAVRRAVFRGLLRNYLNYTNADLIPIDSSKEDKQLYYDSNIAGLQKQHESKIDIATLSLIISQPIMYLLTMSGLRINELLSNAYILDTSIPNTVKFKLNKKKNSGYYNIYIIGSLPKWKKLFIKIRAEVSNTVAINIINKTNKILKTIIPSTFYKQSSHIARGLYTLIIKALIETDMTTPNIIAKYLHHERLTASVHYQNITFQQKTTKKNLLYIIAHNPNMD